MVVCDTEPSPGIPGQWKMCSVCAVEVFMSDSTLNSINRNELKKLKPIIFCLECAKPGMVHIENFIPLTEEQVQEIQMVKHWMKNKGKQ